MVKNHTREAERMRQREAAMPTGVARIPVAVRRAAAAMAAERFVLFVGYPRSGHSLVGQLLNAHPRAIVSHEVDVARLILDFDFDRNKLFEAIIAQDNEFGQVLNRRWTGYDYTVPDAWQGRTWRPVVIGDKKGGGTSKYLMSHPDLIARTSRTVGLPVAVVHVLRGPRDNIASMARHTAHGDITTAAKRWRRMNRTVRAARKQGDWDVWIDLHLDDLVSDPAGQLDRIRYQLGLPPNQRWLSAASSVVATAPSRSRTAVDWTDAAARIAKAGLDAQVPPPRAESVVVAERAIAYTASARHPLRR